MSNKDIIIRLSKELWENHNLDIIDELFDRDAIIHSPFNAYKGSYTMREIAQKWLTAFPDLFIKWEDFIAEDDKVVCRWQGHATHMGSFFDTQPTHSEVVYSGVTTFKLKAGKIIEYWALVDMHAILTQLGRFESISEVVE